MLGPNITGIFTGGPNQGNDSGAFVVSATSGAVYGSGGYRFSDHSFDASDSNDLYGGVTTAQPSSLRVLLCIKS